MFLHSGKLAQPGTHLRRLHAAHRAPSRIDQATLQTTLRLLHVIHSSDSLRPESDGLQPKSDGLQLKSDGLQPKSDGLQPKSDGIRPPT